MKWWEKQQLMFKQEMQKQLLTKYVYYHYD